MGRSRWRRAGVCVLALCGMLAGGDSRCDEAQVQAPSDYTPEQIGRALGVVFASGQSDHFVLHAAAGGDAVVQACAARLEAAYVAFCATLAIDPATPFLGGEKPQAILLDTKRQYEQMIRVILSDPRAGRGAEWEGVVRQATGFNFRGYLFVYRTGESFEHYYDLVAHSMSHQLLGYWRMHAMGAGIQDPDPFPFWMGEGIANYVDQAVRHESGTYCIDYGSREQTANPWRDETHRWTAQVRTALRSRRGDTMPEIRKVHDAAIQSFDHKMRAMAWSLISYLIAEDTDRRDARGTKFRTFAEGLSRGRPVDEMLNEVYELRDLEALERAWSKWARSRPVVEGETEGRGE